MANNRYSGNLKTDDLSEGQKLIQVRSASFSNDRIDSVWAVTKKTKTRLVINLMRSVEGALVPTPVYKRMIVRDGFVTSREEGNSYGRYEYLYTEDDSALPKIAERSKIENALGLAHNATDSFIKNRHDLKKAKAAIEALQAYVDLAEAAGEDD